eukprot:1623318-Pyramimonas_sp.AAC.1
MIALRREARDLPLGPETDSLDMACRFREDFLLPGQSVQRQNRFDYGPRLRRSCWLDLPTPFKLGSGAGLWLSALALLLAIHGTIPWTIDMVEHRGA